MAAQMTKWRKLLWWVGAQPIFTGGFLGPKKAHLLGINRYDDCTLRNVGYFGELVWNPLVLALEFMPRKQGCHTKPCPYNVKNQPLAAPALSKQLPNQEKLFPAVAETFQQSINHWAEQQKMTTTIPWSTMHAVPNYFTSHSNMIPQICIGNSKSYIGQIQHLVEVNVRAGVFNYIILWLAKIARDHSQECLRHHIQNEKPASTKLNLL